MKQGNWLIETRPGTAVTLATLKPNQKVGYGDGRTNHTLYTYLGNDPEEFYAAGRYVRDGEPAAPRDAEQERAK